MLSDQRVREGCSERPRTRQCRVRLLTSSGSGQTVPVFMYSPSTTMKRRVTRALRGFLERQSGILSFRNSKNKVCPKPPGTVPS